MEKRLYSLLLQQLPDGIVQANSVIFTAKVYAQVDEILYGEKERVQ